MGDFSVKAVLSAVDKNFSSTMKGTMGYASNLKSTLTGGLGFGIMMGIGNKAFSVVSDGFSSLGKEAIGTSDSMQKLQAAMRFSGDSEEEIQRIAGATGSLKTYADKTVFSLNDVMSTFGALSANGIKDADKMTEAVGNAVAVFGGGAQEFGSVGLAYSQAMAAGALHAQDWNQILNASPQLAGGLRKELIKLNPVIGEDFKGAMEDGVITADLLGQAMNNIGMTEMAQNAATSVDTFEGAMGNLEATVTGGIMSIYDAFAKAKVVDALNGMNDKIGAGFDWIANKIPVVLDAVSSVAAEASKYWDVFKTNALEVKDAFGEAVSAIGGSLSELNGSFGSTESVSGFSDVIGTASDALKKFAGFLTDHSDEIAKLISMLPQLLIAYKGFKIVSAIAPFVGMFAKGILMLGEKGIGAIAGKLLGIAGAETTVGTASVTSAGQMKQAAVAFLAMGAGVALISAGFYLLAQSAISLAGAGWPAIAVMFGLVAALAALSIGMMLAMKGITASPAQLTGLTTALLALGASILMISTGFAILAQSSIALANAGAPAIAIMVGMVAAIALLTVGAALLGPALTAGAVGFVAFGAAIVLVGVGAVLAGAALAIIVALFPSLIAYGSQAAAAIAQLGAGMLAFAGGTLLAGVACAALGVGLSVVAVGLTLIGVSVLIVAAGVLALAAGAVILGTGMLLTGAALTIVAGTLPTVAGGALLSAVAFSALLGIAMLLTASLLLVSAPLLVLTPAFLLATAGALAFGLAMAAGAVGCAAMALALKAVNSSMKSIASNAKSAEKSISGMKKSVSIVSDGLDALGNKAKDAVKKFTSAFSAGAGSAQAAGKQMADGVKNGVQAELSPLPSIANNSMSGFNASLRSGGNIAVSTMRNIGSSIISSASVIPGNMRGIGYNIGAGLASGMESSLGRIRSIAAQMASAAEQAVRAKAQIHSPSRLFAKLGTFVGQGFADGIDSMSSTIQRASNHMVQIPDIPALAGIGSYSFGDKELRNDYEYSPVIYVRTEVTSVMDGRKVGYGAAEYVDEKNKKDAKLKDRIKGEK